MRKQVNRKLTTAQIARLMHYQGQANAIRTALVAEAASWPAGTWSEDRETRLTEKRAAANALWGDQSRAADDYGHRLIAEQMLLDRLAFVEAILKRLVK
ncbi:MAG TPA: hypothetical protein VFN11_14370 [Ktedonobacterales bacterium]|nr:hypothetical protein [Ktedonobacterales bacterium]